MPPNAEQERLRRLRDRQLAGRDPQAKARKLHGGISRKQRQSFEVFSLGKIWSEIPHIWRYALYGFAVGVLGMAVLPLVWYSPWAVPHPFGLYRPPRAGAPWVCAAGAAIMLGIIGLFIGRAADTRDSLRDLTK